MNGDIFDSESFYNMCQQYRHAKDYGPGGSPQHVVAAFEALKTFIREAISSEAGVCEVCQGRGRARESFERCHPCKGTGIYPPPSQEPK